ncbi:DUF4145 domain-containing protein [Streptomyces sp. NPDC003233]
MFVPDHNPLDISPSAGEKDRTAQFRMTLRCDWCEKESLYLRLVKITLTPALGGGRPEYQTLAVTQLWPERSPRELAPEAPPVVREVFAEGALAEAAGAFRLAGIGYRATVEQIVKDKGASGSNLKQRILALSGMGVSQDIVDAFHEARFVGNDAAHDALAYSAEEIADIAELINEAVLVLYVQPAQRARMAAQRAARRSATKQTNSA